MPSKTKGPSSTKASKENIYILKTNKSKGSVKDVKIARKPLADKTNSASDDNASILPSKKKQKTVPSKEVTRVFDENLKRPQRMRRVPTRYKENNILKNLSNSHNVSHRADPPVDIAPSRSKSQKNVGYKKSYLSKKGSSPSQKLTQTQIIVLKSPVQELDCNLATHRPKRICRLPKKFNDHSVSPNKYTPVRPINASTPFDKKTKMRNNVKSKEKISPIQVEHPMKPVKVSKKKVLKQKLVSNNTKKCRVSDTNNNAKMNEKQISLLKSPVKISVTRNSPKLLDLNKKQLKRDSSKLDVYEFIYDPDDEPQPAKKKKKKQTVRKPKTITIKSSYDKKLAKALAELKNTVSWKTSTTVKKINPVDVMKNIIDDKNVNCATSAQSTNLKNVPNMREKNYNSVRLEDIAKDIQFNEDDHAIDYSPINSPSHSSRHTDPINESLSRLNNADLLKLQDDLSFFDEIPVASSSMNVSVRHPLASPWRVEFSNLPIKWQVNTYVKPNMTPAVESSFINFNDSKKKHVYTNIVPETYDSLPKVIDDPPNLKQTSIISFIKEVAEKQANKKNKQSCTPGKANSLFEATNTSIINQRTPNKKTPLQDFISVTTDTVEEGERILSDVNEANSNDNVKTPKALLKSADGNNTYFGFNDIEDQENISPVKKNSRAKALRSRTRGILQEINGHKGPTRANIPIEPASRAFKNRSKLPEKTKTAKQPKISPEIAVAGSSDISSTEEPSLVDNLENDDSQSIHLFEDIEFIHHHKESCKSYTKSKKVTFHNKSVADSDDSSFSDIDGKQVSNDGDNLDDLSFRLPSERPKRTKKKKPRKKMSKKEEKEVEAWAADFNSMCEDIDEFDLVVE